MDAVVGNRNGYGLRQLPVLSGQLRFPRWSMHTLDLLYWVASALFVFRMLYAGNHGQLRFYVFWG